MLSRLVIAFLPRSKHLLISCLWLPSVVSDFGVQENKLCHYFHCFPIYLPWSDGTRCHDHHFLMLSCKPAFSLSYFNFIKRLFSFFFFAFCHKGDVICISDIIDISPGNLDSSLCFIQPGISHEVVGQDAMIFVFWMLSFKPTFSLSSFTFIKQLFSSSSLFIIRVVSSGGLIWGYWYFSRQSWFQLVLPPV